MSGPTLSDYPIHPALPALARELAAHPAVVLSAPPGAGKSTVVPIALLDGGALQGGILMLEPRRLAARACAGRMADLLGEPVGRTVGYRVRLDQRVSAATRIEVVTEGILTRRLQEDPELQGVSLVIFDELHERSLQADLGLALCRDVQRSLRDDLRLLAMSATLDCDAVSSALGDAPVVEVAGRSHPVEIRYLPREPRGPLAETVAIGVRRALGEAGGDVLAFLPGEAEIRRAQSLLAAPCTEADVRLCPLYGNLDRAAQDAALRPRSDGGRRVVLATSIAETSLTIEGVGCVVDGGRSRIPRFDPGTALTRLDTVRVSRASADQRAGRAGRLGPGLCYRLWTEAVHARLPPRTEPEILSADLAGLALELAAWGLRDAGELAWIDPPPAGALAQARDLLQALDALDGRCCITAQGRRMTALGVHPRLARMVLIGEREGCIDLAADVAALLSERDIVAHRRGTPPPVDVAERLALLDIWRREGASAVRGAGGDPAACRQVDALSGQLRRRGAAAGARSSARPPPCSPGMLLAGAYPDRIGQRRGGADGVYRLSTGRAVRVPDGDPLSASALLVAPVVQARGAEGRIFLACAIDERELRAVLAPQLRKEDCLGWDAGAEAVAAREEERLGALVLSSRALTDPDPTAVGRALLEGVRRTGLECLPWTPRARELRDRVLSLRAWRPRGKWPDLSDEGLLASLEAWLGPWTAGMWRLAELQKLDMEALLRARLDRGRLADLDRLVPEGVRVPSGALRRLAYQPGQSPVLAVRLQELFGLRETPRVCEGEVTVTLHLLSPAGRPVQVTQDLAGFWERTYPEVRKELNGRYPKHYWPHDPWTATPTAHTRPR